MYNLHVVRILLPKVLGQEATMTIFGCLFGTEETAVVEIGDLVALVELGRVLTGRNAANIHNHVDVLRL